MSKKSLNNLLAFPVPSASPVRTPVLLSEVVLELLCAGETFNAITRKTGVGHEYVRRLIVPILIRERRRIAVDRRETFPAKVAA